MKIKTSKLTEAALDWAVTECEEIDWYFDDLKKRVMQERRELSWVYSPSTDWSQGGPIIEREKIRLDCPWPDSWNAGHKHASKIDGVTSWVDGPTPLIAAMRCYVSSKLGDTVDVPEELAHG